MLRTPALEAHAPTFHASAALPVVRDNGRYHSPAFVSVHDRLTVGGDVHVTVGGASTSSGLGGRIANAAPGAYEGDECTDRDRDTEHAASTAAHDVLLDGRHCGSPSLARILRGSE
jgi:hypothetical protein